MSDEWLQCIGCTARYGTQEARYTCDCGNLLSVERPEGALASYRPEQFDRRLGSSDVLNQSGVWRFREGVMNVDEKSIVSHPEGGTHLYHRPQLAEWVGIDQLYLKHEGENPTGSFKDRGMTVAMTKAVMLNSSAVGCASTGNTSASLAAYAAQAGK